MAAIITIQVRRDTAANWTSQDPTLAAGEFGYETDTGKVKIGDGATAWTSLGYAAGDHIQIPASSAQGDVLYRDASSWTRLAAGTSGYFLKTQGASQNPVWAQVSGDVASDSIWAAKGDIVAATGNDTAQVVTVGNNGDMLVADSGETPGVKWQKPATIVADDNWAAKGDLIAGTAADTAQILTIGTNGYILTADSNETPGMKWQLPDVITSDDNWAAAGDLIVGSAADTAGILSLGSAYNFLCVNSGADGLEYSATIDGGSA